MRLHKYDTHRVVSFHVFYMASALYLRRAYAPTKFATDTRSSFFHDFDCVFVTEYLVGVCQIAVLVCSLDAS